MSSTRRIPVWHCGEVADHALVDAEDYAELAQYRWVLMWNGYAMRFFDSGSVRMSRQILGLKRGDERQGDHINGNRLDNRRRNLRIVTPAENAQNCVARGGTSRHRGVSWHRASQRWRAQARVAGKHVHIGVFDTEEEAARAAAEFRAGHMPFANEDRSVAVV
jgi:hypothetical protein